MVTKTMPSASATGYEKVGSWSKLFGSQRQRTYRGEYGRYTSYESKAAGHEKTFVRDSYVPTKYTGVGGDYSLEDQRKEYRKTTTNRYDSLGTRESTSRRANYRSVSVDRDVQRSLRDTDAYFHQQFPHAPRREDEEKEENDVLKRVRRKLRQRSYSVDREITSSGDYGSPFRVVPKREERFTGVINQQKQRAKLGERIEEIYNTKYTRPKSSSYVASTSSAFSRYAGDSPDDAYTGLDYRTLIDGIPNRYRTRGYSEDRDASRYRTRGYSEDREASLRSSSRVSVERELGKRASSVSRVVGQHEMAFDRAQRHERRAASVTRYEDLHPETDYSSSYKRQSERLMRSEYGRNFVDDLNTDRRSGRDLSNLVLEPTEEFQPDHVRVINLSSGKQAVSYDRTRQSGHGADKKEADAAIERVIQRTRVMQQSMYTLEDFVRANRSLFPEDTQIQQQIRFFQLNETELAEMGESPDAVVYGVKIKEKLIVPRGYDVTMALNKYYGNKGAVHVELEERQNIRRQAEEEVEVSRQDMQDNIRKQVELEFEQRDASRILGDQHIRMKEAQRHTEQRDKYGHLHSHVTPDYIRSYYVNAGLDYDSIYEISRGRRSSMGSVQSDVESVCTRTSRASSGGGASRRSGRRGGPDQAPNFTAKLRPKKCDEGATVRFNASVSGLPMPDVAWFKGNRVVTEGGRFHVSVSISFCHHDKSI